MRHHGRGGHARRGLHAARELFEESRDRLAAAVLLLWQRQPQRQHTLRLKPELCPLQLQETSHEEPGAEEEYDRERDLRNDKNLAYAVAYPGLAGAAIRLERFVRIGSRGLDGRQNGDDQAGTSGQEGTPREHANIERGLEAEHRKLRWDQRAGEPKTDVGDR